MNVPFVSEWGSHGMPSAQTYTEIVRPEESSARIGPTLLKMKEKLMQQQFPEIIHHWVEFDPGRLPQMLSRGSAYDQLAEVPLDRFSEAVNAGAGEFYKYSAEAARMAYPRNGGLLFWVWKRPWPIVGIQICDAFGQPLAMYYEVKRAFSSPWPCLVPPYLNYVPGDQVEMKTAVLADLRRGPLSGCRLTARLVGPDLAERQRWDKLAPVDMPAQPEAVAGPGFRFRVPDEFARSFFFVVLEMSDPQAHRLARNAYPFRCPPQLEDAAFRRKYRESPRPALMLDRGPWLRPQLEKHPTTLTCTILESSREDRRRARLRVEIRNLGPRPAVMVSLHVAGRVRYVADDAGFWLEPGESRTLALRLRLDPADGATSWKVSARAWNGGSAPSDWHP
jgi:beta-mannosidase